MPISPTMPKRFFTLEKTRQIETERVNDITEGKNKSDLVMLFMVFGFKFYAEKDIKNALINSKNRK